MKLLPLGSIIKVNNHKVCVIGYGSADKEEKSVCGYFVAVYPVGFTSIDKVLFLPHYADFEVVAEGYKTVPSEKILDTLAKSFEMVEKVPDEELLKIDAALKKIAAKKKEANES
ncbi:DUF4176 domain-containing protein [Anaeromassilibacillus sp. 1001302B_160321_C8]|uniref:DUF4176 domain-containing protein n=1 Tax=Anaeromassilibacillus sp. 1001302B_160321_C8 TaxID=2787132 RepID=UPI001898B6F9|nr:DUF4176 domain-containing protein [Anaeromassilibacillus sp. 1001302B_160321_C8]